VSMSPARSRATLFSLSLSLPPPSLSPPSSLVCVFMSKCVSKVCLTLRMVHACMCVSAFPKQKKKSPKTVCVSASPKLKKCACLHLLNSSSPLLPQVVGRGVVGVDLEGQGLPKALVLLGLCQNSKLTCGIIRADAM